MFKQAESSHKDFIEYITRIAYISELREWDNRFHIERVRRYCYILASGLGLPKNDVEVISVASMLHDIGKISISEDLLKRKGDFDNFEWEIIERHTIEGAIILNGTNSPILQAAETIAHTHHERWDGSGYPEGLKGEEIPTSGRICALADVFDALTTNRTYKDAIDETDAFSLIQQSKGVLFDPEIVDIFKNKFDEILKIKKSVSHI